MKYFKAFFLIFYSCLLSAQVPTSGVETADKLANFVVSHQWKAVFKLTSHDLRQNITEKKLKQGWEHIETEFGPLQSIPFVDTHYTQRGVMVDYRLIFERSAFDMQVLVDDKDEVISFILLPLTYQLPDRMLGKVLNSERVTIETDTFKLPGEIMLPDSCNNCPVVIIVHGSGPNSRNLDYGPNKIYFDIAVFLAEQGIATLRYDKRTFVYRNLMKEEADSLTIADITTDDVLSAIRFVREHPLTDSSPVFVLGHSLGALMAPQIALLDSHLNGVILAGAPTLKMHHLIRYQYHYLLEDGDKLNGKEKAMLKKADHAVAMLDSGNFNEKELWYLGWWRKPFWEEILVYDPVETTLQNQTPTLIIYGDRDYQVPPDLNAEPWEPVVDSLDRVSMIIYPGLNHLFLYGEGPPNRGEYLNPGHFSEDVINDMVKWISENSN